mmetsp:Transcript_23893/g.59363  ORF Transcript_23893/g.59363 Transcript_23893/m.59363 type:complete len:390 (+) Transcript_23893:275-1444(+)
MPICTVSNFTSSIVTSRQHELPTTFSLRILFRCSAVIISHPSHGVLAGSQRREHALKARSRGRSSHSSALASTSELKKWLHIRFGALLLKVGDHLGRPLHSLDARQVAQDWQHQRVVDAQTPRVEARRAVLRFASQQLLHFVKERLELREERRRLRLRRGVVEAGLLVLPLDVLDVPRIGEVRDGQLDEARADERGAHALHPLEPRGDVASPRRGRDVRLLRRAARERTDLERLHDQLLHAVPRRKPLAREDGQLLLSRQPHRTVGRRVAEASARGGVGALSVRVVAAGEREPAPPEHEPRARAEGARLVDVKRRRREHPRAVEQPLVEPRVVRLLAGLPELPPFARARPIARKLIVGEGVEHVRVVEVQAHPRGSWPPSRREVEAERR